MSAPLKRESPPCPECRSENTACIIYGLVSMLGEEWEQGIYVPGGCSDIGPKYHCHECHEEWGYDDLFESVADDTH